MGLFGFIRKNIRDRRLKHECLDEILNAAKENGIVLTNCRLDTRKKDNFIRKELERVKKQELDYKLDLWIGEILDSSYFDGFGSVRNVIPVPAGFSRFIDGYEHGIIGETRNPDYYSQIGEYIRAKSILDMELEKISQELDGVWLLKRERKLYDYLPFYLSNDFTHLYRDNIMFVNGPNDKNWLKSSEKWKQFDDNYNKDLINWESITPEEWESYVSEGIICGTCGGKGEFSSVIYRNGIYQKDCLNCNGIGSKNITAEQCRELFKPAYITEEFIKADQNECINEAKKRGIKIEKANLIPRDYANVYMKITIKK